MSRGSAGRRPPSLPRACLDSNQYQQRDPEHKKKELQGKKEGKEKKAKVSLNTKKSKIAASQKKETSSKLDLLFLSFFHFSTSRRKKRNRKKEKTFVADAKARTPNILLNYTSGYYFTSAAETLFSLSPRKAGHHCSTLVMKG